MFRDRTEAGRLLAAKLAHFPRSHTVVLALGNAGVPVARAVADALDVPMDLISVEPIPLPHDPDVAIGWVTASGASWFNRLKLRRVYLPPGYLARETERRREKAERHEASLRDQNARRDVGRQSVILISDGIAEAGPVLAAVKDLQQRKMGPAWITLATPVVWPQPERELFAGVDEILTLHAPTAIATVEQDYRNYGTVGDSEVRRLLTR